MIANVLSGEAQGLEEDAGEADENYRSRFSK
jgi:hypothetical protein